MKRLFVGIQLPQEYSDTLAEYINHNKERTPWLAWTPVDNLHITLLFIGEVATEKIAVVEQLLASVADAVKPLELTIRRVDYTPPDARSRMVWLYLNESAAFNDLGREVLQAVNDSTGLSMSFYRTDVCISPHVTLARFRADAVIPKKLPSWDVTGIEGKLVSVKELVLFESRAGKQGTVYTVLNLFPL